MPDQDLVMYEDDRVLVIVRRKDVPPAAASALYDLVNTTRVPKGLTPLVRDAEAERIAQGWAEEMARTGDFRHNPNLAAELHNWFAYGENIAWGYQDEATVHQAWMASDPHRHNIESIAYTAVGVGKAAAAGGPLYWVEVFVDRQP
jgi:uncharacterized protein YkwD